MGSLPVPKRPCTRARELVLIVLQELITILLADLYVSVALLFSDKKVGSIVSDLEAIEVLASKLNCEVCMMNHFGSIDI